MAKRVHIGLSHRLNSSERKANIRLLRQNWQRHALGTGIYGSAVNSLSHLNEQYFLSPATIANVLWGNSRGKTQQTFPVCQGRDTENVKPFGEQSTKYFLSFKTS